MLGPPRVILFPSTLSCVALFGSVHGSHDPHQAATRLCPFNAASYLAGPLHLGKVECDPWRRLLVLHEDGQLLDPQTCGCPHNIYWESGYREDYAQRFADSSFVRDFVRELRTRSEVPTSVAQGARC
jgi:hypothetical protein